MSAYVEFWEEKQKIDALLRKGFSIVEIHEHLEGADVQFKFKGTIPAQEQLRLLTADARKYVSSLIYLLYKDA
jgi:hypothetical protein